MSEMAKVKNQNMKRARSASKVRDSSEGIRYRSVKGSLREDGIRPVKREKRRTLEILKSGIKGESVMG